MMSLLPMMTKPLRHLVFIAIMTLLLLLHPAHSLSSSSSPQQSHPPRTTSPPFLSFEFDPSTGICRNPSSFRYTSSSSNNKDTKTASSESNKNDSQFFVLRNVPGDGDCIFHAVLSSVFISMGFMNPDATFVKSDTLVSSMALEMRRKLLCTHDVMHNYVNSCINVTHANMRHFTNFSLLNLRGGCQISIKSTRHTLRQ